MNNVGKKNVCTRRIMLHAEHTVHYFMRREYQLCSELATRCKVRAAMTAAACAIVPSVIICVAASVVRTFFQRKFLHKIFEKWLNKHYHYSVPALHCLLLAAMHNEVVNMRGTSHMCTICMLQCYSSENPK